MSNQGPLQQNRSLELSGLHPEVGMDLAVQPVPSGARIGIITKSGETSLVLSRAEIQQLIEALERTISPGVRA